jgi:hypothetical protein
VNSDDDFVRETLQQMDASENQRISGQTEAFMIWRQSVHDFLAMLRADVPVFKDRAKKSRKLIRVTRRHQEGRFRKKTVEEQVEWAGWPLFSWPCSWKDQTSDARLYILHTGKLLVTGHEHIFKAVEVPDDFLVQVLIHRDREQFNDIDVSALYAAAGRPMPEIPFPRDYAYSMNLTAKGMDEIGAKYERTLFRIPVYTYPQ